MKHHAFPVAMGLLLAAALIPTSAAQAADPTGVWRKAQQGERPGKIEVYRCGSGNRLLCAKIVWLENPLDSKGRPLHDIRNENPSMRGRPILGLPIIRGMQPVARNQWKGNIYNPEDGNTYSATLTLVSNNQINLKGCKAWLLCGERTWVRTSAPPKPEPEPQIEASAEPEEKPATETAAAEPQAAPAAEEKDAFAEAEMLTPAAQQGNQDGYRFLNASASAEPTSGLSGENVPSMFVMTKPIEDAPGSTSAAASGAAPAPAQAAETPKQTIQANAAPAPRPQPVPAQQAAPAPRAAAEMPEGTPEATEGDTIEQAEADTATSAMAEPQRMTWRERRQLRRQQKLMQQRQEAQGLLPWLR